LVAVYVLLRVTAVLYKGAGAGPAIAVLLAAVVSVIVGIPLSGKYLLKKSSNPQSPLDTLERQG
jgi:hypothetical protein